MTDPDTLNPNALKKSLRRELRQRRRALDAQWQVATARAAARALPDIPGWPGLRHIGLYLAADGELDTAEIARLCRTEGRELYLPRLGGKRNKGEMQFALWRPGEALRRNRYGIDEPPANAPARAAQDLDLLLLPLVAWDRRGNRLGMGGGYYDRALAAGRPPLLVGLAHGIQEINSVPVQAWDIRLDYVLTERGLQRCDHRGSGHPPGPGG